MLTKFKEKLKQKKEIYLKLKINPGSPQNEVKEIREDLTIKINITAQPIKNKANKELIKFLAKGDYRRMSNCPKSLYFNKLLRKLFYQYYHIVKKIFSIISIKSKNLCLIWHSATAPKEFIVHKNNVIIISGAKDKIKLIKIVNLL